MNFSFGFDRGRFSREAYLKAGTRSERVFIGGMSIVPAFGAMGVSFVIFFFLAKTLFEIFFGNGGKTELSTLVFLSLFALICVKIFTVSAISLIRMLCLVFTAPPCGSVPAEVSTDVSDAVRFELAPNPFRGEKHESAGENQPIAPKVVASVFGAVFCVVGIACIVFGAKTYSAENAAAKTWVSAPCRIVSAQLKRNTGRKGGTTYSPQVVFEFSVGEKTFRGDKIFFTGSDGSSDYSVEAARLQRFRARKNCWHDPENPDECSLERPEGGFALRKMIIPSFGSIFAIFGAGFSVLPHVGGFSRRKKSRERVCALGELKADVSSFSNSIALILFAVMWNTFVAGFLVAVFSRFDETGFSFIHVFLIPFVLFGIGLAVAALRAIVGFSNPRYALTLAPSGSLPLGGNALVGWRVVRGDPAKMRSLNIALVRLTPSGSVVNGKPKMVNAEEIGIFETHSRAGMNAGEAMFAVPADLRGGKWVLRVSGKTTLGFLRPNLKMDFPVSI